MTRSIPERSTASLTILSWIDSFKIDEAAKGSSSSQSTPPATPSPPFFAETGSSEFWRTKELVIVGRPALFLGNPRPFPPLHPFLRKEQNPQSSACTAPPRAPITGTSTSPLSRNSTPKHVPTAWKQPGEVHPPTSSGSRIDGASLADVPSPSLKRKTKSTPGKSPTLSASSSFTPMKRHPHSTTSPSSMDKSPGSSALKASSPPTNFPS